MKFALIALAASFLAFESGAHTGGAVAGTGGSNVGTGIGFLDEQKKQICEAKVKPVDPEKKECDEKLNGAEEACPDMSSKLNAADSNLQAGDDCLQTAQSMMGIQNQKVQMLQSQIAQCEQALQSCVDKCTKSENHAKSLKPECDAYVPRLHNPLFAKSHDNNQTCKEGQPKENLDKMKQELAKANQTGRQAISTAQKCNGGGDVKVPQDLKNSISKEDNGTELYKDQNQRMADDYSRQQAQAYQQPRSYDPVDSFREPSGSQPENVPSELGGGPTSPQGPSPSAQGPSPQSAPQAAPQQQQQQPQSPQQAQQAPASQQPQSQDAQASAASTDPKADAKNDQTASTGVPPMTAEQLAAAPGHSETPGTMAQAAAVEEKNQPVKPAPLAFALGGLKGGALGLSSGGGGGTLGALGPTKNPDDEEEKLLAAKGLRKPASVLGGESSSSGGGGGKGGWLSSLLGGKSDDGASSSYFGRFFNGGTSDEKSGGTKVDLSQFLPGQNTKLDFRGLTGSGRPAGVHGPHVILWNAVNDRYRSLERTLISEP